MADPSSQAEPGFRLKLQSLITSLQAIEASLDEGTSPKGGPGGVSLSPEARKSLEDAREKLGVMAREIGGGFTGQVALERELLRLASFPELNANPILETNLQGQVLYINPTAQRLFPDLKSLGSLHPYLSGWDEIVQALCKGLVSSIGREVQVGEKTYQQSVVYVKEFDSLRVYGLDVTERHQAEEELWISNEELNEQRAFLQAILQQLPIGVGVFDAQTGGQILRSPIRDKIWRSPPGTIDSFDDYQKYACFHMDGSLYALEDLPLVRTLKSGLPVQDEVMKIRRGDGTEGIVQVNSAPIYLNRELIAGVNVIADITRSKEMENALRQAHDELEQRVEERTEELEVANEELKVEIDERLRAEEMIRQNAARAGVLAEVSKDLSASDLEVRPCWMR
jgi:PAS domain-containing protein